MEAADAVARTRELHSHETRTASPQPTKGGALLWQQYEQQGLQAASDAILGEADAASLHAFVHFCWVQEGTRVSELVLLQLLALVRTCPAPADGIALRHHVRVFYGDQRKLAWRAELAVHLWTALEHPLLPQLLAAMAQVHASVLEVLMKRLWLPSGLDVTLRVLIGFRGVPYRVARPVASKLKSVLPRLELSTSSVRDVPPSEDSIDADTICEIRQLIAQLVAEEEQNKRQKRPEALALHDAEASIRVAAAQAPRRQARRSRNTKKHTRRAPSPESDNYASDAESDAESDAHSDAQTSQQHHDAADEHPPKRHKASHPESTAASPSCEDEDACTPSGHQMDESDELNRSAHDSHPTASPSTASGQAEHLSADDLCDSVSTRSHASDVVMDDLPASATPPAADDGATDDGSAAAASSADPVFTTTDTTTTSTDAASSGGESSDVDDVAQDVDGDWSHPRHQDAFCSSASSLMALPNESGCSAASVIAPISPYEKSASHQQSRLDSRVAEAMDVIVSDALSFPHTAELEQKLRDALEQVEQLKQKHAHELAEREEQYLQQTTALQEQQASAVQAVQRIHELLYTLESSSDDYRARSLVPKQSDTGPDHVERILNQLLVHQSQARLTGHDCIVDEDMIAAWVCDREKMEHYLPHRVEDMNYIHLDDMLKLAREWLHELQEGDIQRLPLLLLSKRLVCALQLLPQQPPERPPPSCHPDQLLELLALTTRMLVHDSMWSYLLRLPPNDLFNREKRIDRARDWYAGAARAALERGQSMEQLRLLVEQCMFLEEHDLLPKAEGLEEYRSNDYPTKPIQVLRSLLSNYPAHTSELKQAVADASVTLTELRAWDKNEREHSDLQQQITALQECTRTIMIDRSTEVATLQARVAALEDIGAPRQFAMHQRKCDLLFHPDKRRRSVAQDTASPDDVSEQFRTAQQAWSTLSSYRQLYLKLQRYREMIRLSSD